MLGYAGLVWVALAPALAAWARRPLLGATLATAAAVWSAELVAVALKRVFAQPRPFETLAGVDPLMDAMRGASMPSGHAATAFAGAVVLAALLRRAIPVLFLLATAIAFSRVYVGVHYPLDVVAGAAVGALAGAAVALLVLRLPRRMPIGRLRSGGAQRPG